MITGAHFIIYSKNSKKDRDFFRQVLKLTSVDAGEGWLIFGLPPSEIAVHPSSGNNLRELYLMCHDIEEFTKAMGKFEISCSPIQNQGWDFLTQLTLPGGGKLGVYQPRHSRPKPMTIRMKAAKTNISDNVKKSSRMKSTNNS